jgi:inosose dehydratase
MIQIANAPCSWGVIENIEGERAGYVKVIDEIAEAGYAGTELGDWGFMPMDPKKLSQELAARKLKLLASWVSIHYADRVAHEAGEKQAVLIARLLVDVGGLNCFIVMGDDHSLMPTRGNNAGRIKPEHGLSDEGWKIYTEGVNRIARTVKEKTGLRCVYHHHCGTWIETPEETEKLLALTDSTYVGLCFDTGHYRFGGGDPVEGLRKHAARVWHIHFKDHDPKIHAKVMAENWNYVKAIGNGIYCELGKGDVDFPAVLKILNEMKYDGWIVVEQDVLPGMGEPKESARRSREYLRKLGW